MKDDNTMTILFETKDLVIITCIFAATGHEVAALIGLVLVVISAWGDRKKKADAGVNHEK